MLIPLLMAPATAAAATPPANDNYLFSTVIAQAQTTGARATTFQAAEDTTGATTQTDMFNPDPTPGAPTSGGGPEPLRCNGVIYGHTVWYDLHPVIDGGVELIATGYPTAVSLYEWSPNTALITRRIGCQVSTSLTNDYSVRTELTKGHAYTVQIGGLQGASGIEAGMLGFTMNFVPDHDGDGTFDVLDDCPTLPGVQRFGGCPPAIHAIPRFAYASSGSSTTLSLVRLDQIPGGAKVMARCRKCGLRFSRTAGPRASSIVLKPLAGRTLAAGDKLEIWVTASARGTGDYRYGAFGAYISYTAAHGTLNDRVLRCLMPGSLTPRTTCPPGGRHHASARMTRGPASPFGDWRRLVIGPAAG